MAQHSSYDARTGTRREGDTASQLRDAAADQIEKVAGKIEGAARVVADQGREVSDQVQIVAGNFKQAVDRSIREQPLTTLAMTAAFAFVLGALWKS